MKKDRLGVPISQAPVAGELDRIRTATLAHLRTENKDRVAQLRAALSEEDQLVLTLRIDRGLDFREIALVTLGDVEASPEQVTRETARLRKRLQLIKDKLRRMISE